MLSSIISAQLALYDLKKGPLRTLKGDASFIKKLRVFYHSLGIMAESKMPSRELTPAEMQQLEQLLKSTPPKKGTLSHQIFQTLQSEVKKNVSLELKLEHKHLTLPIIVKTLKCLELCKVPKLYTGALTAMQRHPEEAKEMAGLLLELIPDEEAYSKEYSCVNASQVYFNFNRKMYLTEEHINLIIENKAYLLGIHQLFKFIWPNVSHSMIPITKNAKNITLLLQNGLYCPFFLNLLKNFCDCNRHHTVKWQFNDDCFTALCAVTFPHGVKEDEKTVLTYLKNITGCIPELEFFIGKNPTAIFSLLCRKPQHAFINLAAFKFICIAGDAYLEDLSLMNRILNEPAFSQKLAELHSVFKMNSYQALQTRAITLFNYIDHPEFMTLFITNVKRFKPVKHQYLLGTHAFDETIASLQMHAFCMGLHPRVGSASTIRFFKIDNEDKPNSIGDLRTLSIVRKFLV